MSHSSDLDLALRNWNQQSSTNTRDQPSSSQPSQEQDDLQHHYVESHNPRLSITPGKESDTRKSLRLINPPKKALLYQKDAVSKQIPLRPRRAVNQRNPSAQVEPSSSNYNISNSSPNVKAYGFDENTNLLKLIDSIRPIGGEGWKAVAEEHKKSYPLQNRTPSSVRLRYYHLLKHASATNTQNTIEHTNYARKIRQRMRQTRLEKLKANKQSTEADNDNDDDDDDDNDNQRQNDATVVTSMDDLPDKNPQVINNISEEVIEFGNAEENELESDHATPPPVSRVPSTQQEPINEDSEAVTLFKMYLVEDRRRREQDRQERKEERRERRDFDLKIRQEEIRMMMSMVSGNKK